MKTVNQRSLEAVQQKRREISEKSTAILERQSEDDRQLSDEETKELAQFVKDMKTLDQQEADFTEAVRVEREVLDVGREIGRQDSSLDVKSIHDVQVPAGGDRRSIGQIFVESEQFKSIQENRSGDWSTGPVQIEAKGTLTAGTLTPGSGTGGGLITVPQVAPGVVQTLFQRLSVADLLPSGQTNTSTIRYVVEGTATSGAAGVLEGGTKPESTLGLSTRDEQVKKIATTLTVTDEMLEDGAQVESYINARLSLFVQIEEERQLLRGSTAAEVPGIIGRSGVNTYARGTVDSNAVAIFKALNGTRGSSLLEPDYLIVHPDNWQTMRLATDTAGQFFGGGPFQGPYSGTGQNLSASGQVTGATDSIWNKPVVVTTATGSGTALLGAFSQAAQLYRRSGITVELSNSHASYFTSDLVAIRAEERLALCVYRPSAFTVVTGLN